MRWKGSTTWSALGNMTEKTAAKVADMSRAPKRIRSFQATGCLSSRQFLAAMRWSSSTQVFVVQARSTQRMRCFFQASDIGVP